MDGRIISITHDDLLLSAKKFGIITQPFTIVIYVASLYVLHFVDIKPLIKIIAKHSAFHFCMTSIWPNLNQKLKKRNEEPSKMTILTSSS